MAYEQILYDVEQGVATITLNRPERLNAWTGTIAHEVKAAMRVANDDDAVRVIVLTGAGRGFCSGADMNTLQGIQSGGASTGQKAAEEAPFDADADPSFQKAYSYFPAVKKPIIAAINGAAAGLGLIMTLYCDMRFASDAAVFTTAFARRGLIAEHGISWLLPRLVGVGRAHELMYTARRFDAAEALNYGFVTDVVPAGQLTDKVLAVAGQIKQNPPLQTALTKAGMSVALQSGNLLDVIEFENRQQVLTAMTDDYREAIDSYLGKRAPKYSNR